MIEDYDDAEIIDFIEVDDFLEEKNQVIELIKNSL